MVSGFHIVIRWGIMEDDTDCCRSVVAAGAAAANDDIDSDDAVDDLCRVRPTILDGKEDIYGHNGNERVSCQELPDLDLRAWKEYQYSDAILCGPSRSAPLKSRY